MKRSLNTVGMLGIGAHSMMFLCTWYNELWKKCHRCGWYGTLTKIFHPNQNKRHYIYHWQVYIAVATCRKIQNPSLCTEVKGNKNAKQSLLQQGLGIMMKQHQQPWQYKLCCSRTHKHADKLKKWAINWLNTITAKVTSRLITFLKYTE